jgi:excisionase family DNA binding protein
MTNYLTSDELCKKLKMPKPTLYMLTSKKRIPHARVGRRLLFEEYAIEKWIRSKQREVVNV